MNKAYLEVSGVASKDESRYVLNGVYVGKEEVVATDGKCLVSVKRAKGDGIQGTGIVPLSAIKDMKQAKGKTAISETILDPEKGKGTLRTPDKEISFSLIQGEFPAYKKVIPTEKPVFEIAFSPEVLSKFMDTLSKVVSQGSSVKMSFYGKEKPVRVEGRTETDQEVIALCLPMVWSGPASPTPEDQGTGAESEPEAGGQPETVGPEDSPFTGESADGTDEVHDQLIDEFFGKVDNLNGANDLETELEVVRELQTSLQALQLHLEEKLKGGESIEETEVSREDEGSLLSAVGST